MAIGRRGRKPGWSTEAQDIVDQLFCYGTLRTGQTMRSMFAQHLSGTTPATIRGKLYAFEEGYPGVLDEGDTEVVGEIVQLVDLAAAFALLDAYEGDEFARVLKRARLQDGTDQWCWVYVVADTAMCRQGELIDSGDWLEYQARE